MAYRSAETAIQERIEGVEREIAALDTHLVALRVETNDAQRARDFVLERNAREGPGGGSKGALLLRIPVVVGTLLVVGALAVPGQLYIAPYVRSVPRETIVPMLMLGGPALLATVIGWPYRRLQPFYRLALIAGFALLALLALLVFCGSVGVFA